MNRILNYILNIQTALAQPFVQTGTSSTSNVAADTGNQVGNLLDSIFKSVPYWVTGFIVIVLSLVLSRIVKSTVENRMADAGLEEEHREVQLVAGRASSAAVLLIGITAGLKIAGLDLTSIIAAAAFGVGFAMQDIIMNFVSGIIILLQKQFTIGDWVKVNGTMGIIKEIQSRYTIIKKFDGTNVIVPNSELFKNQVNSLTTNPERRFTLDIAADFYLDLKEVIDTLYKSIDKCDKILKHPKASIIVQQPGPYYNSIRIRAWVVSKKGILRPISALVRQIHKDFYRKGWSFPYQINHLYFDKDAPPDIAKKAQGYIESHKSALKSSGIVQQQEKVLAEKENETPAQPLPQAQQVGVGGPANETPVWLQQATQVPAPQQNPAQETPSAAPTPTPEPTMQDLMEPQLQNNGQPQATIENIEIGPETKVAGQPDQTQIPVVQIQQETQLQPVGMPIVTATDVTHPQESAPTVAMPLVTATNVQPNDGQQPPQN